MREIISIHVGQAGIQIGNSLWELYCLEHGIQPDGTMLPEKGAGSPDSIFSETVKGTRIPRSIYVDLDPTVVDEVRTGKTRVLFHPDTLINYYEDSANLYSRGYNLGRHELEELTFDQIRKQSEQCDSLQGFVLYHSLSGGTGSGYVDFLIGKIGCDFEKVPKIGFTLYPSPNISTAVVEPYNALLATKTLTDQFNCNFMFDNESLYNLCCREYDIERPTYSNINQLISQASSSLTASSRFDGVLNIDLKSCLTSLNPYNGFHFQVCSYAPMFSAEKAFNETMSVAEMTNSVFEPRKMMLKCGESIRKYFACVMMYRGDVIPRDALSATMSIKTKRIVQFADWCPTGFKVGINHQPPSVVPGSYFGKLQRALCMFANTSFVAHSFNHVNQKSEVLYSKRAFVHLFMGEGMEDSAFMEAFNNIDLLKRAYDEFDVLLSPDDDGEEEDL